MPRLDRGFVFVEDRNGVTVVHISRGMQKTDTGVVPVDEFAWYWGPVKPTYGAGIESAMVASGSGSMTPRLMDVVTEADGPVWVSAASGTTVGHLS